MTEQQGKFLLKFIIDNSYHNLTVLEKESFKAEIDEAKDYEQLLATAAEIIDISNKRN